MTNITSRHLTGETIVILLDEQGDIITGATIYREPRESNKAYMDRINEALYVQGTSHGIQAIAVLAE